MKPPPLSYVRPGTLDEALHLLAEHGEEAKILAGGQSLVPLLNLRLARPSVLVDIGAVTELQHIAAAGDTVRIGGGVHQQIVATSTGLASACPGIVAAVSLIGHVQIRNRGTVGGSLAHADPAAELPLMAIVLDATVTARSRRGARTIPAADFVTGPFMTALAPDEVLVELVVPAGRRLVALHEQTRRTGDFAVVAAAGWVAVDDDSMVTAARIAVCGTAGAPQRLAAVEDALRGQPLTASAAHRAAEAACDTVEVGMVGGPDPDYRRRLTGVLVSRAVGDLAERAA